MSGFLVPAFRGTRHAGPRHTPQTECTGCNRCDGALKGKTAASFTYQIFIIQMKKIFTLAIMAVLAISATAAVGFQDFNQLKRNAHMQLKKSTLKMGGAEKSSAPKTNVQAAANAPESIVGKSFVVIYNDNEDDFNGYFDVVADGDGIILEGFAEGYDVKASYDAATGTITIPTGMVIGTSSTYGDITMHALDIKNSQYTDDPIVGTVEGNKVTFNYGVYGTVIYNGKQGGLIWMQDMDGTEANGKLTFSLGTNNYQVPLLTTKTADDNINIIGLNSLITAGYFYNVPVGFSATAKTATIKTEQPIGHAIATNGTGVKNIYYMFNAVSGNLTRNPSFTITTTDNSSVIKADNDVFAGYATNGEGSYNGFQMSNYQITLDYNLFTQAVTEDPYMDETTATIDGITYDLDNEKNEATVTGCLGSIKDLNIPASIEVKGKTYDVTAVATQAFYANRTLTAVHMPASIKTVGNDAFRNTSNVRSLYIEDLAAWCAIEFYNGNANPLYNVYPSLEKNWGKIYINGTATTDVVVPEGVTKIGRSFYGFKAMTSISLPSTLKEIGDQAFANCTKLTTVTIPEGVEKIGSSFWGCEGLTEISVPGSVKTLAGSTFYNCKAMKTVSLSEGLETIGRMTFSGCKALETITIPSTVNSIAMMAFYGCTGIKEITSLNTVPPTCDTDGMFEDFLTATLFVPEASIDDYKAATSWKEFTTIEGIKATGIEGVESDNANAVKEYYNMQGMKVAAENITPGIYIIRNGSKTTKAYVNAR